MALPDKKSTHLTEIIPPNSTSYYKTNYADT